MLKISKNQIVPGQKVIVDLDVVSKSTDKGWSEIDFAKEAFTKAGFKSGDVITITKVTSGSVEFNSGDGTSHSFFWSPFKSVTKLSEDGNLGISKVEYVIFHNGKKFKTKKYADLGKIKAALLIMMDYHTIFDNVSQNFLDNCPEHQYLSTPEWLGGGNVLSGRSDFKKVEIFEWANRKLGKKVDFDPIAFYDEQMMLIKISSQFGSSARELYKKVKDTHKYMLVFMHEDYSNQYTQFEDLKESDIIKNAMKVGKFKNTSKSTKMGKTAIAFDNATDVIKLTNLLVGSKYFIVDMKGDALVRKDDSLVIQEMRDEKLEALFA
jgi:hypothetical protein